MHFDYARNIINPQCFVPKCVSFEMLHKLVRIFFVDIQPILWFLRLPGQFWFDYHCIKEQAALHVEEPGEYASAVLVLIEQPHVLSSQLLEELR